MQQPLTEMVFEFFKGHLRVNALLVITFSLSKMSAHHSSAQVSAIVNLAAD